jgi:signal transduction histidine kinase
MSAQLGSAPTLPRVLVVDDEEIDREIITSLLENESVSIVHARDGEAALQIVQNEKLDLVLLDIVMPGIDGFEVCRTIKHDLGLTGLPVIIVTSMEDSASRSRALAAGCDDFLTKPFDPCEFTARVRNMLSIKAWHNERTQRKERVREEIERTREQLLQVDRLATLGTLVAGVGHELSNMLSALIMTVDTIAMNTDRHLPARQVDLDRLRSVADHLGTHARYLLNYGRPAPEVREKIDFRDVIRSTLEMLKMSGRIEFAAIETDIPETPVTVRVSRTNLEQILVNLIVNAEDATRQSNAGAPLIRIKLSQSGQRAVLRIEDNGCGIPADKLRTVFQPYYTTKPPGQGTGLGMAVVERIVESYGGKITLTSQEGRGTTLSFDLPLVKSKTALLV